MYAYFHGICFLLALVLQMSITDGKEFVTDEPSLSSISAKKQINLIF